MTLSRRHSVTKVTPEAQGSFGYDWSSSVVKATSLVVWPFSTPITASSGLQRNQLASVLPQLDEDTAFDASSHPFTRKTENASIARDIYGKN